MIHTALLKPTKFKRIRRVLSANKAIDTGHHTSDLTGSSHRIERDFGSNVRNSYSGNSPAEKERGNYNYEFNQFASQLLDVLAVTTQSD